MLEVQNIWKTYEGRPLLCGVSFTVAAGETICLLGASGSGKSTLLRIITGLEQAEQGVIRWDGQPMEAIPVHRRNFGLMFQEYALFPHRSVAENVAFGLRMKNLPRAQVESRVRQALDRVHLLAFAARPVTALSGGEQQRVALARAIAPEPRLLMFDEPLGALDRALKAQLADELRSLLHQLGIPAIYVTHDQEEAFTLADRLIMLHDGQVGQEGSPQSVYQSPASMWVARFLGLNNFLSGALLTEQPLCAQTALGVFRGNWANAAHPPVAVGSPLTLLLRPRGLGVDAVDNQISGVVEDCIFQGESFRVALRAADGSLFIFAMPQAQPVGQPLTFSISADDVQFFQKE